MPEINDECTFVTKADNVQFSTKTNGDTIAITGVHFSKEQAASLAWLINNTDKNLVFEVKLQE